jgi:hypothetical protein
MWMQQITCPECDWHYEEPITEVAIPSAMMEAFSDPEVHRVAAKAEYQFADSRLEERSVGG